MPLFASLLFSLTNKIRPKGQNRRIALLVLVLYMANSFVGLRTEETEFELSDYLMLGIRRDKTKKNVLCECLPYQ